MARKHIKHAGGDLQAFFEQAIMDEIREASVEVMNEVVPATPVDTGNAWKNWQISTNTIPTEETNSNTVSLKVTDVEDTVYIVNNAPYIVRLNEGWSPKASPKFIEHSVAVVQSRRSR